MLSKQIKVNSLIFFSASLWLAWTTPSMASVDKCTNLSEVHDLLTLIDDQVADQDTLAYGNGPLKLGKNGYGFLLKEIFFPGLICKANTTFYDRKVVLNCATTTSSEASAEQFYDMVLDCLIGNGWGQRSIYLVDPKNDLTKAKLYRFEKSFSVDFVREKQSEAFQSGSVP